jgi:hypothetical protein
MPGFLEGRQHGHRLHQCFAGAAGLRDDQHLGPFEIEPGQRLVEGDRIEIVEEMQARGAAEDRR